MRELTFYGIVADGKLKLDNVNAFKSCLKKYDGQDIEIKLKKREDDKTLRQLGYLHAAVIPAIAERTGHSIDEVYIGLKQKYLPEGIDSLAGLSKQRVSSFIDDCIRYAAQEHGIHIPSAVK